MLQSNYEALCEPFNATRLDDLHESLRALDEYYERPAVDHRVMTPHARQAVNLIRTGIREASECTPDGNARARQYFGAVAHYYLYFSDDLRTDVLEHGSKMYDQAEHFWSLLSGLLTDCMNLDAY